MAALLGMAGGAMAGGGAAAGAGAASASAGAGAASAGAGAGAASGAGGLLGSMGGAAKPGGGMMDKLGTMAGNMARGSGGAIKSARHTQNREYGAAKDMSNYSNMNGLLNMGIGMQNLNNGIPPKQLQEMQFNEYIKSLLG